MAARMPSVGVVTVSDRRSTNCCWVIPSPYAALWRPLAVPGVAHGPVRRRSGSAEREAQLLPDLPFEPPSVLPLVSAITPATDAKPYPRERHLPPGTDRIGARKCGSEGVRRGVRGN